MAVFGLGPNFFLFKSILAHCVIWLWMINLQRFPVLLLLNFYIICNQNYQRFLWINITECFISFWSIHYINLCQLHFPNFFLAFNMFLSTSIFRLRLKEGAFYNFEKSYLVLKPKAIIAGMTKIQPSKIFYSFFHW